MRTQKQKSNLLRGSAETARRAREAKAMKAKERTGMSAEHRSLKRLLRVALAKDAAKGSPSPETIHLSREVRMHDEALRAQGKSSEMERQQQDFFDGLHERMQNIAAAGLLENPEPIIEPPGSE